MLLVATAFAFDPDAGVIPSFTDTGTVTVSSNSSTANAVIDGDDQTQWTSDSCFPTGFLSRADLNPIAGACASGTCTGATDAAEATDADYYTAASVSLSGGSAQLRVPLPTAGPLEEIAFRGFGATVSVYAETSAGNVLVGTYSTSDAYSLVRYTAPSDDVTAVVLAATTGFTVTEVAAYAGPCTQSAIVDLGAPTDVGVVRTRHWAGGHASSTTLRGSTDGVAWTDLATLDPDALGTVETRLESTLNLRYLAVTHVVGTDDWEKAYVWEIDAWGPDGPHGPLPSTGIAPSSLREMLGVNGIWGWGTSAFSDEAGPDAGPLLYAQVASHARNYHNLSWDVTDPDNDPGYEDMATDGTQAMWWLDWDREYGAWADAGLDIDVSIQFTNATNPQSTWDDPYQAAYDYASAMARHFGPTAGTGTITAIEAGNEPWDYPADFYSEVVRGFVDGVRAGDPAVRVLTGALQAGDPLSESATGGDYIGARVDADVASKLSALNAHAYSYMTATDGERVAVHPEHPSSSLRSVLDMLRWRDANVPGTPVWLTEWGWDSDGVGESCNDGECVTEEAQALYAVRGALLWSRLGLERADWFFYANITGCDTLFCRSGLTGTAESGFAPKRSFRALQGLLAVAGDRRFVRVLREDDEVWAYALGDADGTITHVAAWRPVDAGDTAAVDVVLDVGPATAAWRLAGLDAAGEVESVPTHDADGLHLVVSATPLIVALGDDDTPGDTADTADSGDTVPTGETGDPTGDDTAAEDDTGKPAPDGCGCASGGGPGLGLAALALAAVWGRRRGRG